MAFYEKFDNIQLTGTSASTYVNLQGQTLSADTIYLAGTDITGLSANTYMVRTSSGFTVVGLLDEVVKNCLEVDTTDGFLHLKGDVAVPGGSMVYGTDVFGNLGFFNIDFSGLTAGEANTASNIGGANELFETKVGVDLRFRTLSAGTGINITQEASAITISSTVNAPGASTNAIQYNSAGTFAGSDSFVYKSGKIGINEADPQAYLDVNGSVLTRDSFTNLSLTSSTVHAANYQGVFVDPATGTLYSNDPATGGTYIASACTSGIIPGLNLYTGGTIQNPIVGLNADISLDTVTADIISGTTIFVNNQNLVAFVEQTVTSTVFSASTSGATFTDLTLNNLVVTATTRLNTLTATTYYGDGSNLTGISGGTSSYVASFSAGTLTANTIYSANTTVAPATVTNIENIFSQIGHTHNTILGFALSDETGTITGDVTVPKLTYYAPANFTIVSVAGCLSTSGSSETKFDIHLNGTTIFSTQPTISSGGSTTTFTTAAPVITASTIVADDKLEFLIDTIATGGKGAKISLIGH